MYADDAEILAKAFETEPRPDLKTRYAFYCGQSYKDAKNTAKAVEWMPNNLSNAGISWSPMQDRPPGLRRSIKAITVPIPEISLEKAMRPCKGRRPVVFLTLRPKPRSGTAAFAPLAHVLLNCW
jgi:hypothetical protein